MPAASDKLVVRGKNQSVTGELWEGSVFTMARAIFAELTTVSANLRAFEASSSLRARRIRLDENLASQQL